MEQPLLDRQHPRMHGRLPEVRDGEWSQQTRGPTVVTPDQIQVSPEG